MSIREDIEIRFQRDLDAELTTALELEDYREQKNANRARLQSKPEGLTGPAEKQ